MKRILPLLAIACCATLLPGCASGPKFSEVKSSFPPLAEENGRIYFYRTTKIGTAKPQGFFYADRPAGNYEVETSTEVKRRLSLTLDKSQTRYVRLNISMGFFVGHVYPELVDDQTGEKEICGCKYTGVK